MQQEFLQRLREGLDYKVLYDMIKNPRDVNIVIGKHPEVPADVDEYVTKNWQQEVHKNPQRTDGDVLGIYIEGITDDGKRLTLPMYDTKFRYLMGTRFNQTPKFRVNLLGSGGVTMLHAEGTDYLLFGKRNPNLVSVGGRVEVIPQGLIKKPDLDKETPLLETLLREAQEEIYSPVSLGLEKSKIAYDKMAITMTHYWNSVAMDYLLTLHDERWLARSSRKDENGYSVLHAPNPKEHVEFYAVPKENLAKFVERHLEAKDEENKLGVATRNRLGVYLSNQDKL